MDTPSEHRAGFVALIGKPNTGKSTLLNKVLGERIAIVSRKPQTTRTRLLGVAHGAAWQLAFLDTPGIHEAGSHLSRYMVEVAYSAMQEVDVVLFLLDASRLARRVSGDIVGLDDENRKIIERIAKEKIPAVLAINKVDLVSGPMLLPLIDELKGLVDWKAIHPISAKTGEGVTAMLATLAAEVPVSEPLFPPDTLTDQAERAIAAEYVREQVLHYTHKEVPYATAVEILVYDEEEREGRGLVRIEANIVVERDSQKGIVIGKKGAVLKHIGTAARIRLERFLGVKVFLGLTVRVEPEWSKRGAGLRKMGYE